MDLISKSGLERPTDPGRQVLLDRRPQRRPLLIGFSGSSEFVKKADTLPPGT